MTRTRDEHLFGAGPKRILALDGGGIRGLITVQILKRIEAVLRQRAGGDPEFRLADYFDLIGGTSTGAIIAAALATGKSMKEIETLYLELGRTIFTKSWKRWGILRAKFDDAPLRSALKGEFGNITLGDERIRTGLAVVMKRLDTGSPWVVHNNPRGRFFDTRPGESYIPNSDYPLTQVVRASTAAPHFFDPERIKIAPDSDGAFVDGGISPHNNPSLQLLMLASLEGHALQWPMGADAISMVSVGTGSWDSPMETRSVMRMPDIKLAMRSLQMLMDDTAVLNETMLQWMSLSPTSRPIDAEVGDLRGDVLGGNAPMLSYVRYDARVESEWLKARGARFSEEQVNSLREMDNAENMKGLVKVGKIGAGLVDESHFRRVFDL